MGVIIPPTYAQVTQEWLLAGAPHPFMVVTGHKQENLATPQFMLDTVRLAHKTLWDSAARGTEWTFGRTRILFRNAAGALIADEVPTLVPGTVTGGQTPIPNSAILVAKRTGFAGVRQRGRMFYPPYQITESSIDSAGVIAPANVLAFQNQFTTMLSALITGNAKMVLLHSTADTPTDVTSLVVQSRVATQRRRLRG